MCKLHRRDFLFGLSGLLLSACGSNEYSDAKDYYPVAANSTGTIYHWGKNNNITVGRNGRIKADIYGKVISIEGEVEGNLFGDEKIVLRQSGVVRGNMTAPRVNLEDGAKFKGSIDMDARGEGRQPILKEAPTKQSESSKVETGDSGKQDAKKDEAESGQRGLDLETDTSSSRA